MKKKAVALVLSFVLTASSFNPAPVFAAETTAEESVSVEQADGEEYEETADGAEDIVDAENDVSDEGVSGEGVSGEGISDEEVFDEDVFDEGTFDEEIANPEGESPQGYEKTDETEENEEVQDEAADTVVTEDPVPGEETEDSADIGDTSLKISEIEQPLAIEEEIITAEINEAAYAGMDIERIEKEYPDFRKISAKGSFIIPGLRSTPVVDREDCDCMTPQGICIAENYILITAYCNSYNFVQDIVAQPDSEQRTEWLAREGSHSEHRSVIYVISKSSHELLNVLVLPDKNHVGGIAFDGEFIWIAMSTTQKLGVIRLEDLVPKLTNDGSSVEISFYTKVSCDCIASFVAYYNRKLWVGVCDSNKNGIGTMTAFDISGSTESDLELTGVRQFTIPTKANGAALAKVNGELCLAINSSYGREKDSKTFLFSVDFENDYDYGMFEDHGSFALPPMAEEICIDGSDVYTLFESGATPYCTLDDNKCNDVVDRVCISSLKDWFEWTNSDYQDEEDDYPEPESVIDGMYYHLSDAEEGLYVPNYVTVPDSDKKTETLYNPYTARMAYEMSLSSYELAKADDNDFGWMNALHKYGYTSIHHYNQGKLMSLGKVKEENNTERDLLSSVNATLGFKKVRYNGKKKISIALAFRGTKTWKDWATNVEIIKDSNGFHSGFADTANECFDSFGKIELTIDGETITLADVVESMKEPDSKYCMIVTGHSLGGAVADLLVGHNLYAAGVYPGNVVAYTFAAARSASSGYRYKYTNIFNIISSDDVVPKVGNDKQIGTNIVYDPDGEFRNEFYPEIDDIEGLLAYVGQGAFGLLEKVGAAHKLDPVYRKIIDIVENDLTQYAPDNVYDFSFDERVYINRNCLCIYENNVSAKGLGLTGGNVYIKGDLSIGDESLAMTSDEDYLLVGGNYSSTSAESAYNYLNAGTVELKGDFTDTYSISFNYGGYREEGTHKTIFSGEGPQRISIRVAQNKNASRFENLVIKNPDIYFDTEIYGIRLAEDAEITSGTAIAVYDHLDLNGYDLKTDGDIAITDHYKLPSSGGQLLTNGGSFDVAGKISCGYRVLLSDTDYRCGSMSTAGLVFNNSTLTVCGDLSIGSDTLSMTNDDDFLLVEGNFSTVTPEINSYALSAGTVELKGDFSDTYSVTFKGGGYKETGTHKTILSGEGPQRISFKVTQNKDASRFENLVIMNPEIYFDTEVYSIRLAADAEITSGTAIAVYDHLDLNGYNLKTSGDIPIADKGQLYTNGGSFDVTGKISCGHQIFLSDNEYICGSMSTAGLYFNHSKLTVKGDTVIYDNFRYTGLTMSQEDDYLLIEGDLTCKTKSSSISGGTIELKGNLTAKSECYIEGLQHVTILSGSKKQTVECSSEYRNKFGTLIIKNESGEGVAFVGKIAAGTLFNHNRKVYSIENESGSSFVDYDGDGKKDNVDRFPTIKDGPAEEFVISEIEKQLFQGAAIEPEITVQYGDENLLKDVDYKVSYSGNDKPGSATITLEGLDSFFGSKTVEFEIYCEHNYVEGSTTEPSCTEAGSRKKTCRICGDEVTEEIPATGHDWSDWTVTKEATEEEEGLEVRTCRNDESHREERTIPKFAHVHKLEKTDSKAATCTEDGNVEYWTCSKCGRLYTDSEGTNEISPEEAILHAVGHSWDTGYTVDKEPTIAEEGSKSIHCSVCDAIKEGSEVSIPKKQNPLGKTTRGDMFNLAKNVKVTWKEVPGAKYYKIYREGITDKKETRKEPVIVTERLIGWDSQPGLTNGHAYRYKIVASLTGKGDPSGDSTLSYSKVMYRLKTVVIRSVKNTAPGKVTVKYDKTTSGDSYVLQYCERQDMIGAKTKVVLGANNTSYVIGGLKKGKTYYISIRVRKKVNGIDYYTTFGVPKKVKIEK